MPQIECKHINNITWKDGPVLTTILPGTVHIYRKTNYTSTHGKCINTFSDSELQKEAVNAKAEEQNRVVINVGMQRLLLSKYLDVPPNEIEIAESKYGKPFVPGSTIHFNVSHSGRYLLIAIADAPIGIDIEYIDPRIDHIDILASYLSDEEKKFVQNADNPHDSLYMLWTRKEALLKASGTGMDDDMHKIQCLDGLHNLPPVSSVPEGNWIINSFTPHEYYVGSIAANQRVENIMFYDVPDPL